MLRSARAVCDKPFTVAPDLIGKSLATPLRRGIAGAVDLVVAFLIAMPVYSAMLYAVTQYHAPGFPGRFSRVFNEPDPATRRTLSIECTVDMVLLMANRLPHLLPEPILTAARQKDRAALHGLLDGYSWKASSDLSTSRFDACNKHFDFGRDAVFGKLSSSLTWFSIMMAYFTVAGWWGKGRTLGKRLCGIRIVRLDGAPLTLWRSFGRTGGYTASLSTLALGFFQCLWDRNRQTAHDQLAGSVVIREMRASSR